QYVPDCLLPHNLSNLHRVNRLGLVVAETGVNLPVKFAKPHNQAQFVGRDLEKPRKEPQSNRDQPDDQDTGTAKAAARQHAAQLVLPAAEQIFQVRGLRTWRRGARSPRPFRARAPGAAALITPRHQLTSTLAGLKTLT